MVYLRIRRNLQMGAARPQSLGSASAAINDEKAGDNHT
jgi:hypothetical protein